MKKIIILTWLSVMLACQSQNIKNMTPTVDNQFETFENKTFNNNKTFKEFLPNGNYIEIMRFISGIQYTETYNDSYYKIIKIYYPKGNIKAKGINFNGTGFSSGIWYDFDENGKLIKETNYDEPYKFTFEDILQFCKKENIEVKKGPILQSTGYHTTIRRDVQNGKVWWEIRWLKTPDTIETIKLDGETGKVLSRTEQHYTNN